VTASDTNTARERAERCLVAANKEIARLQLKRAEEKRGRVAAEERVAAAERKSIITVTANEYNTLLVRCVAAEARVAAAERTEELTAWANEILTAELWRMKETRVAGVPVAEEK
jgi:hypothetical protein